MFDIKKKRHLLRIVIPAYPAFNIYSAIANKTTALGPVCVASVAREVEGWDVEIIDENNLRCHGPKGAITGADHDFLQKERPADVVGLYGGLTSTIPRLYEIAGFYKGKGVITFAGGQHFVDENISEALNSSLDYLVLGEGEETIKEFLSALSGKQNMCAVKGLAFLREKQVVCTSPREPLTDFDKFPIPDFSLVRYAKIKIYPVGRIRGCGMDCEFCTVKGKPRNASPERMLETIRKIVEIMDGRHFFIVDDLFGQHRDETIRFCRMLRDYQTTIGVRLDFTAQIRLDKAKDSELLSAMREAGINTVAIGFESPIAEELEAMRKHIKPEDMIALARVYHRFGFLVHGMFIFGYPLKEGLTFNMPAQERVKRFKIFIKKAKIDTVQILLPVPLPGTELRARLQKQNRVYPLQDVGWEYYDGNFPIFEPDSPVTAEELQISMHKIMGRFYEFKYIFLLVLHIILFPSLLFFMHNFRSGWSQWYRQWRNSLVRFGGWFIIKGWNSEFKKGIFSEKLNNAKKHLKNTN
ncbi:MAG: radical SAM protein [Candidatus Omnitrophica bacterium]|nr:radical SAM protein [Candidatus Omnitrophota bacterium]